MNNQKIIIQRDKLFAFIGWLSHGLIGLKKNWLISALVLLVTGIAAVLMLAAGLVLSKIFHSSILVFILAALVSALLAIAVALLVIAYDSHSRNLKYLLSVIWESNSLRIIFIYLLLLLMVSLGGSLLYFQLPQFEVAINISMEIVLFILQILSFIVIPLNILTKGQVKPFHVFGYGLQILGKNILAIICLLMMMFVVLSMATTVTSLLAHFIGKFALAIYVIEVWSLLTLFVFSFIPLVKNSIQH